MYDQARASAVPTVAPGRGPVHLRVVDLHKSYGEHAVLQGVTFDVYRGSINMILGASGSGKTVLLRQLLRLERPDAGRIEIDGQDIVQLDDVELAEVRRKLGMVFQESALFDSMSVFDNVAFPLRERYPKMSAPQVEERVLSQLRALDVIDAARLLPAQLSGGMKKRVALARAMVMQPEILIYDEPTRGLDPLLARSVDQLIESTCRRFHITSIVISHDMKSVVDIAHYVNLLYEGRIALSASRDEFLSTSHPQARAFLDASGVERATQEPEDRSTEVANPLRDLEPPASQLPTLRAVPAAPLFSHRASSS